MLVNYIMANNFDGHLQSRSTIFRALQTIMVALFDHFNGNLQLTIEKLDRWFSKLEEIGELVRKK